MEAAKDLEVALDTKYISIHGLKYLYILYICSVYYEQADPQPGRLVHAHSQAASCTPSGEADQRCVSGSKVKRPGWLCYFNPDV